jgi:hypothetical protein
MDRRRLVAALVVVALVALAGCDGGPPEREVVCDGCTTGVAEGAPDVAVEESVTHVYLQEDGGARVEARLRLSGSGIGELQANDTRQRRIAEVIRDGGVDEGEDEDVDYSELTRPAFPREDLAVSMDGETLVITYRWTNVSDRHLGTTVLTGFYRYDGQGRETERDYDEPFEVGTDRMVVHGPDGTRTLVAPPGASDRGDRVVWTDETIDTRTYAVFGQGAALVGYAAVALEVLSWAGGGAAFIAVPTALALGLVAVLFAGYYPKHVRQRDGWHPRDDGLFWILAGLDLALLSLVGGFVAGNALGSLVAFVVTVVAVVAAYLRIGKGDEEPTDSGATTTEGTTASGETTAGDPTDASATDGPTAWDPTDDSTTGTVDTGGESGAATGDESARGGTDGLRYGRHALAVGGVAAVTLAVTAAIAVDFTASYAGTVAVGAMVAPLVSFVALGYLATTPGRGPLRAGLVAVVVVTPWVVSLGQVVNNGGHQAGAQLLFTVLWAVGVGAVGLLAFYGVLWASSR